LEEAAWFLDLVGRWSKPVILVGSMRPATALSADGPANLYQAVSVCADPAAAGRGVMVVMAADILSGWRAVKISATALNGFHAYPGGLVGYVSGDQVFFYQGPDPGPLAGRFAALINDGRPLPLIGIQFCTAGCAQLHNQWWPQGRDAGLVVAGFGGGTVPDTMADALRERANSGTSIVISSRVPKVTVLPETMTLVESDRVVASRYLNPQKAAVLLSLSLAAGCTPLSSFEALH
jgi:L-asparaginase